MILLHWTDLNRLNWITLSKNPNAIQLSTENQYQINWHGLSSNLNAIQLLTENQNKINWYWLSTNPSIFTYDYKKIKQSLKKYFIHQTWKNGLNGELKIGNIKIEVFFYLLGVIEWNT